jgi:hypothetical protein
VPTTYRPGTTWAPAQGQISLPPGAVILPPGVSYTGTPVQENKKVETPSK